MPRFLPNTTIQKDLYYQHQFAMKIIIWKENVKVYICVCDLIFDINIGIYKEWEKIYVFY